MGLKEGLLLPDVVPRPMPAPVCFLEEVGLHGRLVDGNCRCKEAKAKDHSKPDACLLVDLEFPYHGDWNQGEDEIGRNVHGRIEDAHVLEDGCIVAFTGAWFRQLHTVANQCPCLPRWRSQGVVPSSSDRTTLENDSEG
jgi:hypothetical protein